MDHLSLSLYSLSDMDSETITLTLENEKAKEGLIRKTLDEAIHLNPNDDWIMCLKNIQYSGLTLLNAMHNLSDEQRSIRFVVHDSFGINKTYEITLKRNRTYHHPEDFILSINDELAKVSLLETGLRYGMRFNLSDIMYMSYDIYSYDAPTMKLKPPELADQFWYYVFKDMIKVDLVIERKPTSNWFNPVYEVTIKINFMNKYGWVVATRKITTDIGIARIRNYGVNSSFVKGAYLDGLSEKYYTRDQLREQYYYWSSPDPPPDAWYRKRNYILIYGERQSIFHISQTQVIPMVAYNTYSQKMGYPFKFSEMFYFHQLSTGRLSCFPKTLESYNFFGPSFSIVIEDITRSPSALGDKIDFTVQLTLPYSRLPDCQNAFIGDVVFKHRLYNADRISGALTGLNLTMSANKWLIDHPEVLDLLPIYPPGTRYYLYPNVNNKFFTLNEVISFSYNESNYKVYVKMLQNNMGLHNIEISMGPELAYILGAFIENQTESVHNISRGQSKSFDMTMQHAIGSRYLTLHCNLVMKAMVGKKNFNRDVLVTNLPIKSTEFREDYKPPIFKEYSNDEKIWVPVNTNEIKTIELSLRQEMSNRLVRFYGGVDTFSVVLEFTPKKYFKVPITRSTLYKTCSKGSKQ